MTWKRVATAAVLIPLVVVLVWKAPTALLSVALSLVVLLAMFEFFALGVSIGHRAYRYWTAVSGILLVYVQYLAAMDEQHSVGNGPVLHKIFGLFKLPTPTVAVVFFIFLIGIAILTLATRRPLVEALPAAGISSSALLLVALPLSFAVRLHGIAIDGPFLLFFSLVITWVGDTAAYFVGRAMGRHRFAPHLSKGPQRKQGKQGHCHVRVHQGTKGKKRRRAHIHAEAKQSAPRAAQALRERVYCPSQRQRQQQHG